MIWYTIPYNTIHYHNTIRYDTTRHEELSSAPWTRGGRRAWARPQFSYRCLRNKRPLQKRTLRLSNPCPPKINVVRVTSGSGSACKINTRFRKTGSALAFQLWTWGGRGRRLRYDPTFSDGRLFCKHLYYSKLHIAINTDIRAYTSTFTIILHSSSQPEYKISKLYFPINSRKIPNISVRTVQTFCGYLWKPIFSGLFP